MDAPRTRAVVVVRRDGVELIRWSVVVDDRPDLEVLDDLARAALEARRCGDELVVEVRCPALDDLISFAGLDDVLR